MVTILYMPDGNRRFAKMKGISFDEAYNLGSKTLKLCSKFFIVEKKADIFIFYAMSDYTNKRTDLSLGPIYDAIEKTFQDLIKERFFEKNKISVKVMDNSGKLPKKLKKVSEQLQKSTKNYKDKKVIVLLGYSLKEDINQALSRNPENYSAFRRELIFPNIDLVIRPLEMRISGGPVYAMSQAQMMILDKLNPEVKKEDLEKLWKEYCRLKDYVESSNSYHKKRPGNAY